MLQRSRLATFALVLVAACVEQPEDTTAETSALHASYTARRIDYPGSTRTIVLGVNNFGRYVGLFVNAGPHAMIFDGHTLAPLDATGVVGTSPRSRAYAINNLGHVVGSYSDTAGNLHGFVMRGNTVTTFDAPDGAPTELYGINDLGEMIGVTYDDAGNTHGFTLWNGVFRAIDIAGSASTVPLSINDFGTVVGEDVELANTIGHGFRRTHAGTVTTYDAPEAPADSTYFVSINNLNRILGAYFDEDFHAHHFILDGSVATPFALPASLGAVSTSAQTINDLNHVVGYYTDAAGATHGFYATRGH
jgi:hypothetical protein